jgi:HAD superfamily hydrolase (TIGR01509 family)
MLLILGGLGVIAETSELHRKAYNMALYELGMPWQWDREEYAKLLDVAGGKARLRLFLTQHDPSLLSYVDTLHTLKTRFYHKLLTEHSIPPRDGLVECIKRAQESKIRLAIASTTSQQNIMAMLNAAKIPPEIFAAIGALEHVSMPKPASEIYDWVRRECRASLAECIAVEDSHTGVAAANEAGISCYALPGLNTAHQDFSRADQIINSYTEISLGRS